MLIMAWNVIAITAILYGAIILMFKYFFFLFFLFIFPDLCRTSFIGILIMSCLPRKEVKLFLPP